jgi:hypothetical protein
LSRVCTLHCFVMHVYFLSWISVCLTLSVLSFIISKQC